MNVILDIPEDLQTHIKAQIQAGIYSNAVEYFLELGQQDRQRQSDRNKIAQLLQESLDSDSETVNSEYWQRLSTRDAPRTFGESLFAVARSIRKP